MKREKFEAAAAKEFSRHGGSPMTARVIGGAVYGFGSELATLRCFKKYVGSEGITQGYSENRKTFYFAYDVNVKLED